MRSDEQDAGKGSRFDAPALLLVFLLIVFTSVIDLQTPRGVTAPIAYMTAVLAALWTAEGMRLQVTILVSVVCSALTVVGYFLSAPGGVLWMTLLNRGLALAAIWLTAVTGLRYAAAREQVLNLTRSREREARRELKTLSGLLPICAHCKKIRDDEGYWQQLEQYIMTHSEAQFSHGFCPRCEREHYGSHLDDASP